MEKSEAIQAVIEAGQTIRNHILLSEDFNYPNADEIKAAMLQEIRAAAFQFKAAADYAVNDNDEKVGSDIISNEDDIKTLMNKSAAVGIDYRVNVFACYNNIRFVKKHLDSSGSSAADLDGFRSWLKTVVIQGKTSVKDVDIFISSLQTITPLDAMRWYRRNIGNRVKMKEFYDHFQAAARRQGTGWTYRNFRSK